MAPEKPEFYKKKPENVRSELGKIESSVEKTMGQIAQGEVVLQQKVEDLNERLSQFSNLLTPKEKEAFAERIANLQKEIQDILHDRALNEFMPPDFKHLFAFNASTRVLYLQTPPNSKTLLPILEFEAKNFPMKFKQNGKDQLIIEYQKDGKTVQLALQVAKNEVSGKGKVTMLGRNLGLGTANWEYDLESPQQKFDREVAGFRITGNEEADTDAILQLLQFYKQERAANKINPEPLITQIQKFIDTYSSQDTAGSKYLINRLRLIVIIEETNLPGGITFSDKYAFRKMVQESEEIFKNFKGIMENGKDSRLESAKTQISLLYGYLNQPFFIIGGKKIERKEIEENESDYKDLMEDMAKLKPASVSTLPKNPQDHFTENLNTINEGNLETQIIKLYQSFKAVPRTKENLEAYTKKLHELEKGLEPESSPKDPYKLAIVKFYLLKEENFPQGTETQFATRDDFVKAIERGREIIKLLKDPKIPEARRLDGTRELLHLFKPKTFVVAGERITVDVAAIRFRRCKLPILLRDINYIIEGNSVNEPPKDVEDGQRDPTFGAEIPQEFKAYIAFNPKTLTLEIGDQVAYKFEKGQLPVQFKSAGNVLKIEFKNPSTGKSQVLTLTLEAKVLLLQAPDGTKAGYPLPQIKPGEAPAHMLANFRPSDSAPNDHKALQSIYSTFNEKTHPATIANFRKTYSDLQDHPEFSKLPELERAQYFQRLADLSARVAKNLWENFPKEKGSPTGFKSMEDFKRMIQFSEYALNNYEKAGRLYQSLNNGDALKACQKSIQELYKAITANKGAFENTKFFIDGNWEDLDDAPQAREFLERLRRAQFEKPEIPGEFSKIYTVDYRKGEITAGGQTVLKLTPKSMPVTFKSDGDSLTITTADKTSITLNHTRDEKGAIYQIVIPKQAGIAEERKIALTAAQKLTPTERALKDYTEALAKFTPTAENMQKLLDLYEKLKNPTKDQLAALRDKKDQFCKANSQDEALLKINLRYSANHAEYMIGSLESRPTNLETPEKFNERMGKIKSFTESIKQNITLAKEQKAEGIEARLIKVLAKLFNYLNKAEPTIGGKPINDEQRKTWMELRGAAWSAMGKTESLPAPPARPPGAPSTPEAPTSKTGFQLVQKVREEIAKFDFKPDFILSLGSGTMHENPGESVNALRAYILAAFAQKHPEAKLAISGKRRTAAARRLKKSEAKDQADILTALGITKAPQLDEKAGNTIENIKNTYKWIVDAANGKTEFRVLLVSNDVPQLRRAIKELNRIHKLSGNKFTLIIETFPKQNIAPKSALETYKPPAPATAPAAPAAPAEAPRPPETEPDSEPVTPQDLDRIGKIIQQINKQTILNIDPKIADLKNPYIAKLRDILVDSYKMENPSEMEIIYTEKPSKNIEISVTSGGGTTSVGIEGGTPEFKALFWVPISRQGLKTAPERPAPAPASITALRVGPTPQPGERVTPVGRILYGTEKHPYRFFATTLRANGRRFQISNSGCPGYRTGYRKRAEMTPGQSAGKTYDLALAAAQLRSLKAQGVKMIYSFHKGRAIASAAHAVGMDQKSLSCSFTEPYHNGRMSPAFSHNIKVWEEMGEKLKRGESVHIHCAHGAHRAPSFTTAALIHAGVTQDLDHAFKLAGLNIRDYKGTGESTRRLLRQVIAYAKMKGCTIAQEYLNFLNSPNTVTLNAAIAHQKSLRA